MQELEDYRQAGLKLYNKLRLLTFPVAIKFIKDFSEIPEKAGIYMLLDKFGKDVNHGWNKTDNLKYRIHEEHYSRKFSFIRIIITKKKGKEK